MIQSISSANISQKYSTRNCSGCKKPGFGLQFYAFEKPENPAKKRLKRMTGSFVHGAIVSGIFDAVRAGYNYITKKPQLPLSNVGANAVVLGLSFVAIDSVMNMYYNYKAKKIMKQYY